MLELKKKKLGTRSIIVAKKMRGRIGEEE